MNSRRRDIRKASSAPSPEEIVGWDVGNWSQALRFWERTSRIPALSGKALELGAGRGGLSLWLARKGFQVICSDFGGAREGAKELHARYGLTDRIEYRAVDATDIPYDTELDLVCFKSVLGAVGSEGRKDRQQRAVDAMYAALKPGGEVWFAENLVGSPLHRYCREHFVPWGRSWRWISVAEVDEFFAKFRRVEYVTVGFLAAFGRSERQRRVLALMDGWVIRHVPPRWRYIAAGVAAR